MDQTFEKSLISVFVEQEQGTYEATLYRCQNSLVDLSYLSQVIENTKPTILK
jgi:hypothetical protein